MVQTLVAYGVVAAAALWLCRPLLRPLALKARLGRGRRGDQGGCSCGGSGCGS